MGDTLLPPELLPGVTQITFGPEPGSLTAVSVRVTLTSQ